MMDGDELANFYNYKTERGFRLLSPLVSLSLSRSRSGGMAMVFGFDLLRYYSFFAILATVARSELVISRVDRHIELTSHITRAISSLKIENVGSDAVSEVLLAFPNTQAKDLAAIMAYISEGKGKGKGSAVSVPATLVEPKEMPPELTFYSVSLPKELEKGESLSLDVLTVFTHLLKPFPEEISQADVQLVLYQDSAYFLSPYKVKFQSLVIKLPSTRVESYTKHPIAKLTDSEIRYGPFENLPAFSNYPVIIHFENNHPFPVAHELVREIEISHWGNVQVTEHYTLIHGGANTKGGFSRFDYQSRPSARGLSSFRYLIAKLPPRAHSVYYRDEIGNISTSHLWGDSRRTQLEIEPRFPIFGGWKTTFTIGYGLPLQDFLFKVDGKRMVNITLGCPMDEVVVDHLIVKVVLPEGSTGFSVSLPLPMKQWQEMKFSHLDIVGRPVVVLEKYNIVPEQNNFFQVYYKFNNLSLLREPIMLISGFFFLFLACIMYMHSDMSLSRSSASYLAKLQYEEVQATVEKVQRIIIQCLAVHEKLEASLRDLSRTGDVQSCKAARKTADGQLKDLAKDAKPFLTFLQQSPQSSNIWQKVEELVAKEKEMQDKLMLKHSTVVDSYEKRLGGREIENRIAPLQQKLAALKQEVDDLVDLIDEM